MPQKSIKLYTVFKQKGGASSLLVALLFLCVAVETSSCKKAIEQQQKNIIIQAITTGHWYVQLYQDSTTTDVTSSFNPYEFQFYENGSVEGIKNNQVVSTGTWSANLDNYSIISAFPASANDTLRRLNYTWKITDSGLDFVKAKTPTSIGDNVLNLRKK